MTLRARLALVYGGTIVVTIALVGLLVSLQFRAALVDALDRTLNAAGIAALTTMENGQAGFQEGDLQSSSGVFLALFDASGAGIDATANAPAQLTLPGGPPGAADVAIGANRYRAVVLAVSGGGSLVVGGSLASIDGTVQRLVDSLVLAGGAAAIASLAGGWLLAGRALKPVANLTREAAQIDTADLDRRLPIGSVRDEMSALATTLNSMLDRVGDSVARQRRFVAAASHDLRTPIAALQTELELATDSRTTPAELRAAVQQAHADALRLGQLASALLELAAVEPGGRVVVRSEVDVAAMLEAVVARTEALARARDVEVRRTAGVGRVRVDRIRLEQALTNLVTNAITHGPPHAEVTIAARIETTTSPADHLPSDGAHLLIEVLDQGDGVAAGDAASLFEPFRRGPGARGPGAGLGLATAAAAIKAHHGTIGVTSRDGGGARFWLRVPL